MDVFSRSHALVPTRSRAVGPIQKPPCAWSTFSAALPSDFADSSFSAGTGVSVLPFSREGLGLMTWPSVTPPSNTVCCTPIVRFPWIIVKPGVSDVGSEKRRRSSRYLRDVHRLRFRQRIRLHQGLHQIFHTTYTERPPAPMRCQAATWNLVTSKRHENVQVLKDTSPKGIWRNPEFTFNRVKTCAPASFKISSTLLRYLPPLAFFMFLR